MTEQDIRNRFDGVFIEFTEADCDPEYAHIWLDAQKIEAVRRNIYGARIYCGHLGSFAVTDSPETVRMLVNRALQSMDYAEVAGTPVMVEVGEAPGDGDAS